MSQIQSVVGMFSLRVRRRPPEKDRSVVLVFVVVGEVDMGVGEDVGGQVDWVDRMKVRWKPPVGEGNSCSCQICDGQLVGLVMVVNVST